MSRFGPNNIYENTAYAYSLPSDVNVVGQPDDRTTKCRSSLSDSRPQDDVNGVTSRQLLSPSGDYEDRAGRVLVPNLKRRSHIRRSAFIPKSQMVQDQKPSSSSPSSSIALDNIPHSRDISFLTRLQIESWRSSETSTSKGNSPCSPLSDANTPSTSSPSDFSTPIDLRSHLSRPRMAWDITESKQREGYSIFTMRTDGSAYSPELEDGGALHRQNTAVIVELLRQRRHRAGQE